MRFRARRRTACCSRSSTPNHFTFSSGRVAQTLSTMASGSARPSPVRSSLRKPRPARTRCAVVLRVVVPSRPCSVTVPPVSTSSPKIARTNSLRPEPMRPPIPSTSPALRSKLASWSVGGDRSARTDSATSALGACARFGKRSITSRPTICAMIASLVVSAIRPVPTLRPSRKTV